MNEAIAGYAMDAADLVPHFEAIAVAEIYAPVAHLLPASPVRMTEIGAGTGRDAAWFAGQGHSVLAVEPVAAFRQAGMTLHPTSRITWLDDMLPLLPRTIARGERFDLVLLTAVWQHLAAHEQRQAISPLAALVAPGGRLILSIRHGPGAPTRPCFPADPDAVIADAAAAGLRLAFRQETESVQPSNRAYGVTWTWLAFSA